MNTQSASTQKNSPTNDDHQGKSSLLSKGLGLAIAMALGATIGLFLTPKNGQENQKELMDKAKEVAKRFKKSRADIQETLQNIFGEVSEELEKDYLEVQGNIAAQVEEIKDKAELTHKKYDEIIQDTVEKFSAGKDWTEKSMKAFIKELQKDWK